MCWEWSESTRGKPTIFKMEGNELSCRKWTENELRITLMICRSKGKQKKKRVSNSDDFGSSPSHTRYHFWTFACSVVSGKRECFCVIFTHGVLRKVFKCFCLQIITIKRNSEKAKADRQLQFSNKDTVRSLPGLKVNHQWNLFWSLGLLPPPSSFCCSSVCSLSWITQKLGSWTNVLYTPFSQKSQLGTF